MRVSSVRLFSAVGVLTLGACNGAVGEMGGEVDDSGIHDAGVVNGRGDAGTTVTDSGTTVTDSGTTVTDSGTTVTDSGTTVADSGTTVTDSGTAVTDAGTRGDAGGASDAGRRFDAGVVTVPGDGGVPTYIAALAPFEVKALRNTLAPTNGKLSMESVTPSEWLNDDPGVEKLPAVINDWCGGAKPLGGTKLYVHGGGHNGSANNGLYVFDYAGDSRPTGWALPSISPLSAVVPATAAYSDGLPSSSHTADTTCMLHGSLYRISAIGYNPSGGFGRSAFKYEPTTDTWVRLADSPTANCYVFPNEATNKILCIDRWYTYQSYYFYNATTDTFSSVKQVPESWPDYFTVAYKPLTATTGVALMSGSGKSFSSIVDWNAETITQVSRSLGTVSNMKGPGCFYDPERDRFWMFGGNSDPRLVDEIDPSDWSVTSHTLTGDPYSFNAGYNGTFSRFVFMPEFRAVGFVPTTDGPAYVMRLP